MTSDRCCGRADRDQAVGVGDAIELAPMTADRYAAWRSTLVGNYAADKVAVGEWPAAEALQRSEAAIEALLSEGLDTPDHHVFVAEVAGEQVGTLWVHTSRRLESPTAFICDIDISPERRNRGYGRALLAMCEAWCVEAGMAAVSLHVFAHNTGAIHLYEKSGYAYTDHVMRKNL